MAGGHGFGAEVAGDIEQVVKLDRLVAAYARHRGFAAQVTIGEFLDHRVTETAFVIEHIVGDADLFGSHAGVVDILASAAGTGLFQRRAVIVKLERDADDFIAGLMQEGGDHSGIDSAGHGGDHACAFWQAHAFAGGFNGGVEIGRLDKGYCADGHGFRM